MQGQGHQRRLAPLLPCTQASAGAMQPALPAPLTPTLTVPTHQLPPPALMALTLQQQLQQLQLLALQSQLSVAPSQLAAAPTQAELAARAALAPSVANSTASAPALRNVPAEAAGAGAASADMMDIVPDFSASHHEPGSAQVRMYLQLCVKCRIGCTWQQGKSARVFCSCVLMYARSGSARFLCLVFRVLTLSGIDIPCCIRRRRACSQTPTSTALKRPKLRWSA
jgi:hypothetical protein